MQVGCVRALCVCVCVELHERLDLLYWKMKRFSLLSANYSELSQYAHTRVHTLVRSVAALTRSDVMKAIC